MLQHRRGGNGARSLPGQQQNMELHFSQQVIPTGCSTPLSDSQRLSSIIVVDNLVLLILAGISGLDQSIVSQTHLGRSISGAVSV